MNTAAGYLNNNWVRFNNILILMENRFTEIIGVHAENRLYFDVYIL